MFELTHEETDRLNPPPPRVVFDERKEAYFLEMLNDPRWLPVGYIPTPRSRLGWFAYHLVHGLVMQYPVWKVIGYSILNTGGRQ